MKLLISVLTLALSFAAGASSGETKSFTYDGSQNSVELLLKGEKTHTEYRTERRSSICYRTDVVGYRTICNGGRYGGGYGGGYYGRGYPGGYYGPSSCWREPIYGSVSYPCTQTVQIPYEVRDYDVEAKVTVSVSKLADDVTPGETISVTLHGETITLSAKGSKKFLLVQTKSGIRAQQTGSVKYLDAAYKVELAKAAPLLAAIKMGPLSVYDSALNFQVGDVASRANLGFSLNVVKHRTLRDDPVIFDKELTAAQVVLSGSQVQIDLNDLGLSQIWDGKYSLTPKVFVKFEGPILNKGQFDGELEASRTIKLKN